MNLMNMGLATQQMQVAANQARHYSRIVGKSENAASVLREAAEHGCSVWADSELKKTVICRTKPATGSYCKVIAYPLNEFIPKDVA